MRNLNSIFLFLCLLLLAGCRLGTDKDTPSPAPSAETRPKSVTIDQPRTTPPSPDTSAPFRHFVHVSELYDDDISRGYARPYAIAAWATDGTLISVDENSDEDQLAVLFETLDNRGVRVGYSLYLEGPGGPTGDDEFGGGELLRIAARAQTVCQSPIVDKKGRRLVTDDGQALPEIKYDSYTTEDVDSLPWMVEWNETGWPEYFRRRTLPRIQGKAPFQGTLKRKFVAIEIDNLERHLQASGETYGQFLEEFASWTKGSDLKLVLKNLNYDDEEFRKTEGVLNHPDKKLFVGFYIAEIGDEDDRAEANRIAKALKPLGIVTVLSTDTMNYMTSTDGDLIKNLKDVAFLREIEQKGTARRPASDPVPGG